VSYWSRRWWLAAACAVVGGAIIGATVLPATGDDPVQGGRATPYDGVSVLRVPLTRAEGGGFVLCITTKRGGIACDFLNAQVP
jgi:hypothetical protein